MRKLFALLTVLIAASIASAATTYRYEDTVRTNLGRSVGGATVTVYLPNTTTKATIYTYSESAGGVRVNPVTSDSAGRFWFYLLPGTYDIKIERDGIETYTIQDVSVAAGGIGRADTDPQLLFGSGAPDDDAPVGSLWQRSDAVSDSTLYIHGPTDWYSVMMPVNRTGSQYAQFGDQSPDVSGTDFLIFSNHAPTTVTTFDGGVDGQILSVYISDSYTVLTYTGIIGGLHQPGDIYGAGSYCVYRYSSSPASWFLLWSSDMSNVATDYYLDDWDPYGTDATLPVLADPQFWPGWDADAPRPLYNLVSGSCVAALDSTVVLDLDVTADEAVMISTMVIADGDTTIANYAGSFTFTPSRTINTGTACSDGDTYVVNYKIANASGHESPWWRGGVFTVVIDDYEPVVLANLVGTPGIIGLCDTTADIELALNADIISTANYCWTKVGSGDTSSVASDAGGSTLHVIEIATDSLCVNGSMFDVFVSLTNDDNDVTGPRHGPYRYTVSGLDETPPSQGVPTLTGQCSNSLVAMQLSVTSAEPCYLSAQWRLGSTGTWVAVPGQTTFNVLHNVSIATDLACVNNQVFYVQYRLTDQFQNTSAWFSGGSYTVSVAPPPGDTMWPIINPAGCAVVASVVNGNTVLTVTIDADETFSAYARAVSGTNTITFGVPHEAGGGVPVYNDPCTRVINTSVVAVQGQTWVVSATLWDDEVTPNYTSPPYSNYVGTAIVDMTPTFGPEVTAVSGDILDNGQVIINGTGFGTKSPAAPIVYDDFDDGTIGARIGSPWYTSSADPVKYPKYSDAVTRGTSDGSVYQDYTGGNYNSTIGLVHLEELTGDTQSPLYVSGWFFNTTWGNASRNCKLISFRGGGAGAWEPPDLRCDWYPSSSGGHIYATDCDNSTIVQDWGIGNSMWSDEWHRLEAYQNYLTGYTLWRDTSVWGDISGLMHGPECYYRNLYMMAYYAKDLVGTPLPEMNFYWDELYIDKTRARVEIGNSPSWSACTHREIQIPSEWSSNSITIELNQGMFEDGSTQYLFVVDSEDRRSSGYPVTWGEEGPGSTDTTAPSITPVSYSYENVPWGAAGVDSLAVIVEFGVSEPAKVVGQIMVTYVNGVAPSPYVWTPAGTSGNWSSTYSTSFRDTLFTEESWMDTVTYTTRFLLEDRAGNMSSWTSFGAGATGIHNGVPEDTEPEEAENDTIYYMFGYGIPANHPVVAGTPYLTGHVVQDSLYYFQWSGRRGTASATSTTATTYFQSHYEFGGYSDPLDGGFATTDTNTVAFSGVASARRLSGMGDYITEAKYYFRMSSTLDLNTYTFGPSPNFYAAAVCTNSVLFEAESVAMGNPPPYNYMTNNISYNTVGEGTWDAARTSFDSLAKYGIGVNTQQTFIWSGAPYPIESWYVHDFTAALQSWYAEPNNHGVIIAQMGHAPGTTTEPAFPDFGAWRSSSILTRPVLLVKLVIPRTLRIPAGINVPTPKPDGHGNPSYIEE